MLLARRECVWSCHWLPVSLSLLLLLISFITLSSAHSTMVEHDVHIVHNVDNRSPEIDPSWYVGRGVRPIGRFGKRHAVYALPSRRRGVGRGGGPRGLDPVLVGSLELLLNSLRGKDHSGEAGLPEQGRDWLP